MTVQLDELALVDLAPELSPGSDAEFDLDLTLVESGPVVADLMTNTDDGCGSTCDSACANSGC